MTTANDTIVDERGRVMFHCATCGGPLTKSDFFDLGMRLPDRGESADEYCDAELLDGVEHVPCAERTHETRAG